MAGVSADGLEITKNKSLELNNNNDVIRSPPPSSDLSDINEKEKSSGPHPLSDSSSSCSEPLECGVTNRFIKQRSLQDLLGRKDTESKIPAFQRGRSNSDGAAVTLTDNAEVFPSLPVTVLERMGLYGDVPRERLSEESLEQKFTSLSLAFTIDAATIKDRCERQRRTRDQTETNFNLEVEKLREKLALLQPLCTDFDRAELLSTLFAQVETLTKAAHHVSIAGERFGAVQHEERLTESVQLMVTHVQALKNQRDSARKQLLQHTKRVLQAPFQPVPSSNQKNLETFNKKSVTKRRASIDPANLSRQEHPLIFTRRVSDWSFRTSLAKMNRPSRLELGLELNKIKEISLDDSNKEHSCKTTPVILSPDIAKENLFIFESKMTQTQPMPDEKLCCENVFKDIVSLLRENLFSSTEVVMQKLTDVFTKWPKNGYLYAFLNSCAVLCFSISILTLVGIFLEQDYVRGFSYWILPWYNRKK